MRRTRTSVALIALELLVAVTAIGGGIALALGLEGERFPLGWLAGTPFGDYLVPGLLLAVLVGGTATGAAMAHLRRSPIGARVSLVAGVVLVGWIFGEVILVSADSELVSPMEALYLVVGLVMIGLAIRDERASGRQRRDADRVLRGAARSE